jgi:hypothetical protein
MCFRALFWGGGIFGLWSKVCRVQVSDLPLNGWVLIVVYGRSRVLEYSQGTPVDRAMAQAVSRRPLTAEARVHARVNPCGICRGQSGTGIGFSPSSSASPANIIPPSLSKLISSEGWTICPLVAAVQRRSLTPSKSVKVHRLVKTRCA